MKKLFVIFFIVLCSKNAFALYNSNITNGCTKNHIFFPVFQINTYTCSPGYYLPANTEGCRPCPNGATCSGGTFTFNTTTAQGIVNITNGCNGSYRFAPVFQINSYTCQSGYFLPANTEGCQPCPTGATCSGGTFTFNTTTAQGIVVNYPLNNTVTKGCSGNLTDGYVPVFTPNNISLTWQDENGNTIDSGTCSYGEAISVPSTIPTKTGYTFTGWQVVSN